MFKPVGSKVNFPELESSIIAFWKEQAIFAKSVAARKGRPTFILYEGPPTANARPGIHHTLARIFKDVMPRYKTMKGYYAPRKGGWDTHGLPVELEVEKELGFSSKTEIEAYGVERFNALCRESVLRYVQDWEALTERIGFWVDMKEAYITFKNEYIESCWWILKQLWDRGLIYRGYKVTPHCPRCGSSLSSHEVALGYEENTPDPSVYIKFKVDLSRGTPSPEVRSLLEASPASTYILAWTTTPWTLPANVALAVAPGAEYTLVQVNGERFLLADSLLKSSLLGDYTVLGRVEGSALVGLHYEPLYSFKPPEKPAHRVIPGDFVSLEDGTGVVHIAPAYGEIDLEVGQTEGLPLVHTVDLRGHVVEEAPAPFAGLFIKDVDPLIMEDLKKRGLLYRRETIRHTYPFCWRCHAPLLYYAKSSWYIRTTAVKDKLIAGNDRINWYPDYIKYGRFGDWLQNNVDWAFSRERYWGTPFPLWQCENKDCAHYQCLGSVAELKAQPGLEGWEEPFDLHRPFVDRVTFRCPQCGGRMQRVPEVIDCWFDSGAMPVAQWHYPFENQELFAQWFPADYICEAVDQTRGWFYSLHAISTLLFDRPCFRHVICLGHILDSQGEKMSKSKGNVVNPWTVLDSHGADALRWYLLTASPPGNVRRFSVDLVGEALRKFLLTLWNTYSFFVTYANIDGFDPRQVPPSLPRSELDLWILSELHTVTHRVTQALDNYDPTEAGRRLEDFVDNLSNWYVRRSRRRFWKSENDADKQVAYATLYQCLVTLSKLLAPFVPFVAEELYQNLVRSADRQAKESVHLEDYPVADLLQVDEELTAATRLVMKVASLGRAARSKARVKVRQPLAQVLVRARSAAERDGLKRLEGQILDELNVKELAFLEDESAVADFEVKPSFALLGPKYGSQMSRLAQLLARQNPKAVALRALMGAENTVEEFHLSPQEVMVTVKDKPGYATASEGSYFVAVTTQLSPELAEEGLARELVHRLQTMRRAAGFDIADYIHTYYQGDETIHQVMQKFGDYVRQETLSREHREGPAPQGAYQETLKIEGKAVTLGVIRVRG